MRRFGFWLFVLSLGCLVVPSASAEPRKRAPSAKTIQSARSKANLDTDHTATMKQGKRMAKVTPAKAPAKGTLKLAEAGLIIGEMELAGLKPFPRGIFPVYLCKVGKGWRAYSVANGKTVLARKASVDMAKNRAAEKPKIVFNLTIVIRIGRLKITIEW